MHGELVEALFSEILKREEFDFQTAANIVENMNRLNYVAKNTEDVLTKLFDIIKNSKLDRLNHSKSSGKNSIWNFILSIICNSS